MSDDIINAIYLR